MELNKKNSFKFTLTCFNAQQSIPSDRTTQCQKHTIPVKDPYSKIK